jgi:hypothetical protein
MPDAVPDACLAACAIAYTRNPPNLPITSVLNITTHHSLLNAIIKGYETNDFAKNSVSKSSQVPTFCDFFDFKILYYKFRKNPGNHQNIRGDRACKRLRGPLWDAKISASHCQDNQRI